MTSHLGTRVTRYSSSVGKAYLAAFDDASGTAAMHKTAKKIKPRSFV
jgi:DNA-binding IclR family transcriptional regulator